MTSLSIRKDLGHSGPQQDLIIAEKKHPVIYASIPFRNFNSDVIGNECKHSYLSIESLSQIGLLAIGCVALAYLGYNAGLDEGYDKGWSTGKADGYEYGSTLEKKFCEIRHIVKKPWFFRF